MFVVKHNQEMVNKTFRFPAELLEKLERIAKKNRISVSKQMTKRWLRNSLIMLTAGSLAFEEDWEIVKSE